MVSILQAKGAPADTTLNQLYPSIGLLCHVWPHNECRPTSQTAGQHYPSFGSKHRAGIVYATQLFTIDQAMCRCNMH